MSTQGGWTTEKLEALRQRYGGEDGGGFRDPRFRKVAERIFHGSTRAAPYSGVPTLLDATHRPVDAQDPDFSGLDVALLGIPMDLGVTNRPGARFGPRAVRDVERIGPYNHVLECAPLFDLKVADVGDVPMRSRYRLEMSIEDIERHVDKIVAAGVAPVAVGGDHSCTYPILKAMAKKYGPVGLVHVDAHCDTGGPFDQSKFHHGGPFRNLISKHPQRP